MKKCCGITLNSGTAKTLFSAILLLWVLNLPVWSADTVRVLLKGACVRAEVVDSDLSRQRGLMFREKLLADEGMLFVFDAEGKHGFWMKNMNFPLDIIWIAADKSIVDIKTDCPPCGNDCPALVPKAAAKYVLEVTAGFSRKYHLKIRDKLEFNLL